MKFIAGIQKKIGVQKYTGLHVESSLITITICRIINLSHVSISSKDTGQLSGGQIAEV
jgi:hypothetical protein